MITVPTVFILGAGASIPYGLPSGHALKLKILHQLNASNEPCCGAVIQRGYNIDIIRKFTNDLKSPDLSIDAFLEHRSEYQAIGKLAIAWILLNSENKALLHDRWWDRGWLHSPKVDEAVKNSNWYGHLFNLLSPSLEDFRKNKLSIITFNYDRSIEQYLFEGLKRKYGLKDKECASYVEGIPIIHVHGSLGQLPWCSDCNPEKVVPYQCFEDVNWQVKYLDRAAKQIKIIYEADHVTEEFQLAHQRIAEAGRVYFLGFGFNETNISRLFPRPELKNKTMKGTSLGLSWQNRSIAHRCGIKDIMVEIGRSYLSFPQLDAAEFISNHPGLDLF